MEGTLTGVLTYFTAAMSLNPSWQEWPLTFSYLAGCLAKKGQARGSAEPLDPFLE